MIFFFFTFIILSIVALFPYFKQTKKNLMWLVLIFILISASMVVDLGLEFLPFAYLLVYVGAVAVMFLFVIVTIDPKFENQKDTFEDFIIPAVTISNCATAFLYFCFSSVYYSSGFNDLNKFFLFKDNINEFYYFYLNNPFKMRFHYFTPKYDKLNETLEFVNNNWLNENLSLYSILEFKFKDVFIFADYLFSQHAILLIIVSLILTTAMIVSVVISKDFSKR